MARTPPHTPWKMHPTGIPFVICGSDRPTFGPITFAGTKGEMMVIATVMHAAPEMLAALRMFIAAEDDWNARDGSFDDPLTDAYNAAKVAIAKAEGA